MSCGWRGRRALLAGPTPGVPQQPLRLPGLHVRELLGEARRIGRGRERLLGQDRRGGVVPVAAVAVGREARDDDVGPEACGSPTPRRRGPLPCPRCASVSSGVFEKPKSTARVKNCSAPSMRRAASSSCVRITPERVALLGADQVLAAVAARERQVRRCAPSAPWRARPATRCSRRRGARRRRARCPPPSASPGRCDARRRPERMSSGKPEPRPTRRRGRSRRLRA